MLSMVLSLLCMLVAHTVRGDKASNNSAISMSSWIMCYGCDAGVTGRSVVFFINSMTARKGALFSSTI